MIRSRFRIVRTDRELEMPVTDQALRDLGADLVLLPEGIPPDELIRHARDADLLLMCYTPIPASVINATTRLRAIVKYGVGIDAIDIPAARARSIPVVNIPAYAESTVAEAAFTLMAALAKKLIPLDRTMQRDGWAWPTGRWLGRDIAGSTLGLVGLGRIGRSMARMAGQGFGARVTAYDPNVSAAEMQALGVEKSDHLSDLLAQSDCVSIHCVLTDETRHLIGAAELALMKPHATLINVSRGAIVDESALLHALTSGTIAGAGLDAFSEEPLARTGHPLSPLYAMENVILMPHLAFYTAQAMARLESETLDRCREALEDRDLLVKSNDPRLRAQGTGVTFGS